jgi:hypothetical protein
MACAAMKGDHERHETRQRERLPRPAAQQGPAVPVSTIWVAQAPYVLSIACSR